RRTHGAIRALRDLRPAEAIVLLEDGRQKVTATRYVPIDARILIRPGDRVPLDGTIMEGESSLNEAPITGESMLRSKGPGDPIFAGAINGEGRLVVRVTRVATETQLARIIHLVTQARAQQPRVERLFDRIGP